MMSDGYKQGNAPREYPSLKIFLFMKKVKYTINALLAIALMTQSVWAGNPDRQGEAGAAQLLLNPWARSAGFHSMNTSSVSGTEAMFLNVAGLANFKEKSTQLTLGHTRYLEGADVGINALGFARRIGNGAFGISLMAMDFGGIEITTDATPGGSGAIYNPSFFNMGLSYSHLFVDRSGNGKVLVGTTAKIVSEAITNASARTFALDAGVQYMSGPQDNFKFGVSLRNVGGRMRFAGEGLSFQVPNPDPAKPYQLNYYNRSSVYELPSQLNIGTSYDFIFNRTSVISVLGNFTSNAFARDQIGVGAEFRLRELFAVRLGYKHELEADATERTLDTGLSAGFSLLLPVTKNKETRLGLDYGFRATNIYQGIHNLGLRLEF
jgi:Type IX secretion system membrane protein PorP/SprF